MHYQKALTRLLAQGSNRCGRKRHGFYRHLGQVKRCAKQCVPLLDLAVVVGHIAERRIHRRYFRDVIDRFYTSGS